MIRQGLKNGTLLEFLWGQFEQRLQQLPESPVHGDATRAN